MIPQATITLDRERTWRASSRNTAEFYRALGGRKRAIERLNDLTIDGKPDKNGNPTRISNPDVDEMESLDVLAAVIWSGIMQEPDCPALDSITTILTYSEIRKIGELVMPLFTEGMMGERPTPAAELETVSTAT